MSRIFEAFCILLQLSWLAKFFALHGLAHARLRCAHGFASSKILSFFAV